MRQDFDIKNYAVHMISHNFHMICVCVCVCVCVFMCVYNVFLHFDYIIIIISYLCQNLFFYFLIYRYYNI